MSRDRHAPGPIRVEVVDLEALPERIDPGSHAGIWVVVRRSGIPRAIVELDVSDRAPSLPDQIHRVPALTAAEVRRPSVPDADLPAISVIVPSIVQRTDGLEACLQSLDQLDYPDFEVIVADNRATVPADDPLPAILARTRHVRSVRAVQPGVSAARNAGVLAARGDVVAFTDDDVQVDPGWLRAFGRRFATTPDLDLCTGLILPAELETPAQIYFERYYGGFAGQRLFAPMHLRVGRGPLGRARVVVRDDDGVELRRFALYGIGAYGAGASMAMRRSTLIRLGGFNLALGTGTAAYGGDDLAIFMNVLWAGGAMTYEPAAAVYHKHRPEYEQLRNQLRASGAGFTATLTALVLQDPRHLVGLTWQLPIAARRVAGQTVDRLRGRRADRSDVALEAPSAYPPALVLSELGGMPRGPLAYLRSRRSAKEWARAHGLRTDPLHPLDPGSAAQQRGEAGADAG